MEEHGGEISSTIVQSDDEEHEMDSSHSTSSKDSILRIPSLFKLRNEQAYMPYKFSIGPWHFDESQMLRTGQKLKESFLERLLQRFPNPAAKESQLEEAIKNVHGKARECYEGGDVIDGKDREVKEEEFENILLLDGCFIIEVLHTISDPVLLPGANYQVIYHDLLLLDNQIPWFVLELLFNETNDYRGCTNSTLVELAINFFGPAIPPYKHQQLQTSNILHLVDFVWRFLVGSREMKLRSHFEWGYPFRLAMPSVTRLEEVGVKFQQTESKHTLDVTFEKGVLEIPRLRIDPLTETIFRNLIVFEQCIHCAPHVTWSALLRDCLVDTSDDVELMSKVGIFGNRSNPEETADLFNRVRDNTIMNVFCYAVLCQRVNDYCERRWPRWRASLIQNYFTRPWAIVSVVFATIVLFFTIMQVFYK